MVVTWPSTLPVTQMEYSESDPDNVLISANEVGPPTTRLKSTSPCREVDLSFRVDATTKRAFSTFYKTTCVYGSVEFQRVDFSNQSGSTFRYLFRSPPNYQHIGGNKWLVSLSLWVTAEL